MIDLKLVQKQNETSWGLLEVYILWALLSCQVLSEPQESPQYIHELYHCDMPKSRSIDTKWATLEKLYNFVSACIVEIILKDNSTTKKQGLWNVYGSA